MTRLVQNFETEQSCSRMYIQEVKRGHAEPLARKFTARLIDIQQPPMSFLSIRSRYAISAILSHGDPSST
jgi:hypothetical protein